MTVSVWTYYLNEISAIDAGFVPTRDNPGIQRRDTDQPIDGFWRVMGAKTKHDLPAAVWRQEGHDHVVIQIGRQQPMVVHESGPEVMKFIGGSFVSCAAVRKADWDMALASGFWPDGRPSRDVIEITDYRELALHLLSNNDADLITLLRGKVKWYGQAGKQLPGALYHINIEAKK